MLPSFWSALLAVPRGPPAESSSRMALLRRRSGRQEVLAADDMPAGNVGAAGSGLAMEALGDSAPEFGTTPGFFESTPLMIDGVLYVTTPYNSMAALDAETGKELWRFDGEAYKLGQILSGSGWKLRGTAFWRDGRAAASVPQQPAPAVLAGCRGPESRIRRSATAAPCRSPTACRGSRNHAHATQSSPPVVYRDLVIVGSQVPDRVQLPDPMGYVQAFDARTGKRVWAFSRDSAVGERSGRRHLGERIVAEERARQRVGADGAGRGARAALPADVDADERLLRRRAAGRQPVRRIAGVSRRGDRQDEVALSDGASRALGLRHPGAAEPGDDHRERAADRRGGAGHQAGIHVTCSIA